MCRYVGVGRYLDSSVESEEGIDGRPTLSSSISVSVDFLVVCF